MDGVRTSLGYRGYIASRPVRGASTPQHVQNLVIRDYAARNGLTFKLSATEYAMEGCYLMLEAVLDDLANLDGIVFYSVFMLPRDPGRRNAVYRCVLDSAKTLHGALENLQLGDDDDVQRLEDIFLVAQFAPSTAPSL